MRRVELTRIRILLLLLAVFSQSILVPSVVFAELSPTSPDVRDFDLLLLGGQIIDGSGRDRYFADIGIVGDRIGAIGDLSRATADRTISLQGRILSPGFIDLHAHLVDGSDGELGLLSDDPGRRAAYNYVSQGITTALGNPDGWQPPSLSEQRKQLERPGIGLNIALTSGHNELRAQVMGNDQERPATRNEIRRMQEALLYAMENEGSFGLSLGLEYYSGRYASTAELIELAKILPAHNGILIPHLRSQGAAPIWYLPSVHKEIDPPTLDDAIDEVLAISRATDVRTVFTHMKAWGPGFRGQGDRIVAKLEEARARGGDIYMDVYPYVSSYSDGQFVAIPNWAFQSADGNASVSERTNYKAHLQEVLADASLRQALYKDIRHTLNLKGGPENIVILAHPERSYVGKRLSELMALWRLNEVEMILRLQREGDPLLPGGARLRAFSMAEEDIKSFYGQSWVATSTDGWVVLPEKAIGDKKYDNTHRRVFGSFPRRIAYYSQKEGVDTLEQAIRSMTGLPAEILMLSERGRVAVGMMADLVVLDLERLKDNTTYLEPSAYPSGIDYVLVNGELVVDDGNRKLKLPGRVLRPAGRIDTELGLND